MAQKDRMFAIRAGRDHVDGRADEALDALEIAPRGQRQRVPDRRTERARRPAGAADGDGQRR